MAGVAHAAASGMNKSPRTRPTVLTLLEGIGEFLYACFGPLRSFPPFWSDPVLALQQAVAALVLLVAVPVWLVLNWPRWLQGGMDFLPLLGIVVLLAYLAGRRARPAPGPRTVIVSVAALVLGVSGILDAWYAGLAPFPPFSIRPVPVLWELVGVLMLVAAVGIWRLQGWARWLGVALQALTLVYPLFLVAYGVASEHVTVRGLISAMVDPAIRLVIAAGVLWALLWHWPSALSPATHGPAGGDLGVTPSFRPWGKRRRGWHARRRRP